MSAIHPVTYGIAGLRTDLAIGELYALTAGTVRLHVRGTSHNTVETTGKGKGLDGSRPG